MTNLRFADDVLLIAQSKTDVSKMLKHFSDSASQYGLKLNYDKTKVMTWDSLKNGSSSIAVAGNRVEILGESVGEKYLGRSFLLVVATKQSYRTASPQHGQRFTCTKENYATTTIA